ncbi:hypothetical protein [Streptomyces carpinensis]|uniref:Uncharacterized protein n=1 Tax=Streptomyces carpinensis TaxID=66369 RepID=A0ABV1VZ62_9ACTN|nr:hypothetical protein [Streptomyces carpinensis]
MGRLQQLALLLTIDRAAEGLSALLGPGHRVVFRHAARAGSVVQRLIGDRRARVLLTGSPLSDNSDVFIAEPQDCYL